MLLHNYQDSEQLEKVLNRIAVTYTDDLATFIRKCLSRNFHQRPTTGELCQLTFARESLQLIGSSLVANEVKTHKVAPPDAKLSAVKLGEYIEKNVKIPAAVEQALQLLKKKSQTELAQVRRPILLAMNGCKDKESIVLLSYDLILTAGLTTDLVRPLLSSMRACASSDQVRLSV